MWQELGDQHSAVVSQTQLHASILTYIPISFYLWCIKNQDNKLGTVYVYCKMLRNKVLVNANIYGMWLIVYCTCLGCGTKAWYGTWLLPCAVSASQPHVMCIYICILSISNGYHQYELSLIYIASRGYWLSFFSFHFPACRPGMYKAGVGNTQCQSCPANSTVVGAVTCNCTRGHYRMNGEGAADPCTSKLVSWHLICA